MQDNSERVNLVWASTRASSAHISATVKDPLPGLKVVLPEEQAPRNSKDLEYVSRRANHLRHHLTLLPKAAEFVLDRPHSN